MSTSRQDLLGLSGRIVMVTGAGRGFGRSIAHSYGRNGATVITVDPDVELATGVASEVEALGSTAIPIRGDMSVVLDVMNTFEKVEELFGMLDGIVHVTTADSKTAFVELLESEWYDLLNADVKSSLYVLQQGLRYLNGGGFVTIILPPIQRDQPHITSIRGAVAGLIEGATRIFPTNVRVNGVIPSRDPSSPEYDQALVRGTVGLGSMVSEGIRGQLMEVLLPDPPQPPEIYDLLRELP